MSIEITQTAPSTIPHFEDQLKSVMVWHVGLFRTNQDQCHDFQEKRVLQSASFKLWVGCWQSWKKSVLECNQNGEKNKTKQKTTKRWRSLDFWWHLQTWVPNPKQHSTFPWPWVFQMNPKLLFLFFFGLGHLRWFLSPIWLIDLLWK